MSEQVEWSRFAKLSSKEEVTIMTTVTFLYPKPR